MGINHGVVIGLVTAMFLLTGCGGGGGSSKGGSCGSGSGGPGSDGSGSEEPTPSDSVTGSVDTGAFLTTITSAGESVREAATLLSPSGRMITVIDKNNVLLADIVMGEDGRFADPATHIYYRGGKWVKEENIIGGQATDRKVIESTLKDSGGNFQADFRMERDDALSAQGASLTYVNHTFVQSSDSISTSLTISADGSVTGSDSTGCSIAGQITVPDTAVNVYEVALEFSLCESIPGTAADLRNGAFTGLGLYDHDIDQLELIITNGKIARAFFGT